MDVTAILHQIFIRFKSLKPNSTVNMFITLAILTWVARFWFCNSFGMYEDDYAHFSRVMILSDWSEFWKLIIETILRFPQGRPLHFIFIYSFAFVGFKLNGLQVVYWIGYLVVTCNSFLFYLFLKRLNSPTVFSVMGAFAFCLFPGDTTQALLTHTFGLQTSLMLFLIASLCYFSGKYFLSYFLIFCSLLCYETSFAVFFVVPLLVHRWDLRLVKIIVKHTLILLLMIVLIIIIRKVTGENRIVEFDVISGIITISKQMIIGPIVSLIMFIYRPFFALKALTGEILILVSLCFACLAFFLYRVKTNITDVSMRLQTLVANQIVLIEMPIYFRPIVKLTIVGIVMLLLAYPLTFTVSAMEISGRASRVHLAGIFGGSIICASLCSSIFYIASIYKKKWLAAISLAGFFALLLGFELGVQQDYKLSWQYQKEFWSDVIRLCPDITDGTVILIEPDGLLNPKQILAYSWSLPHVLEQIYRFPNNWKFKPRLYKLKANWQKHIVAYKNSIKLNGKTVGWMLHRDSLRKFQTSNVILLEKKNGSLVRKNEILRINNQELSFRISSDSKPQNYSKGWLYEYLITQ